MQVWGERLQIDVEIHGRAETTVAVGTLVLSAHPLPSESEIRSVEGPDEGAAPKEPPQVVSLPPRCQDRFQTHAGLLLQRLEFRIRLFPDIQVFGVRLLRLLELSQLLVC